MTKQKAKASLADHNCQASIPHSSCLIPHFSLVPFLLFSLFSFIFLACPDGSSSGNSTFKPVDPNNPVTPEKKTLVVFDNTYGVCDVLVFDGHLRRDEDKIASVPAGRISEPVEWYESERETFYFAYVINLNDVNNFTMTFVPENGKDQKSARIEADETNVVLIPGLDEILSSPEQLLSSRSYIMLRNASAYTVRLHRGDSPVTPDMASLPTVNSGVNALYTINTSDFWDKEAGTSSNYRLLVGADYINFPAFPGKFEPGYFYAYTFNNGAIGFDREIPINFENVVVKAFTISFNANGGSGTLPSATAKAGSSIKLPNGDGLSKTGYVFSGWNLAASGNEFNYSAGADYLATGDITLYAKWNLPDVVAYTVTFNSNGGSPVSAQYLESGHTALSPKNPIKSGYAFIGWYSDAGFNTAYDFAKPVTGDITLYAKWDLIRDYTVAFFLNGGYGSVPFKIVGTGTVITLPNGDELSKAGYTLGGWSTSDSGGGTVYSPGASYTVLSDITLFAKWDPVGGSPTDVEMVYVPGGSFEMGDVKNQSGNNYFPEKPVHMVTLSGFYLGKYEVTQAQYQGVTGKNPGSFNREEIYPVESVSWYDAVEFCNALSLLKGLSLYYSIDKANKDPNNKSDFDRVKWTVTRNSAANGYRLPTEAQWEYAAKGGNGSPGNYTYSGSNTADDVAWYTNNNGNSYGPKAVGRKAPNGLGLYDMSGNVGEWCWDWIENYSIEPQIDPVGPASGSYRVVRGGGWLDGADVIRSAYRNGSYEESWTRGFRIALPSGSYTVSFDSNGGSPVTSQTVNFGGPAARPANPARDGYTFDNWYADLLFSNVYNFSTPVTGDITLYARWNNNLPTHTVTFNSNGGSAIPNQDVVTGGTAVRPANPVRDGYTFDGWYGNPVLNMPYDFSTPVTANITLYAKWYNNSGVVTNGFDRGPGSLRYVLERAEDGSTINIDGSVGTISINSTLYLPYIRNITIEGNGVTLTRGTNWSGNDTSLLVNAYYTEFDKNVIIRRIHFKGGVNLLNPNEEAALVNRGTMNVESCIFSNNKYIVLSGGSAIVNHGTMTVKGCTFYGNRNDSESGYGAGAIGGSTITLTGNLFYGNINENNYLRSYPVAHSYETIISLGYNVVNEPFGTGDGQCGWVQAAGDKLISEIPFSTTTFRLLQGSGALNVITTLPADYPGTDFYGNPIRNGAAAGAVQSTASGTGFYLDLSVNDAARGSVNASPAPNADGLVSGTITLTASARTGYDIYYWLIDGTQSGSATPLTLTINSHTRVQAVFGRVVLVTNFTDDISMTTPGTLRRVLADAQDFDIIRFSGVTAGQTTINLKDRLEINKNVTIEGNGVTITRDSAWTTVDINSQLLIIGVGYYDRPLVKINRVHFKDGRTTESGAAVTTFHGTLALESCIFSGNRNTIVSRDSSGAIFNNNGLSVKGCTFYDNSSVSTGGVIYSNSAILTLEGNLFYNNSTSSSSSTVAGGNYPTSLGYNLVDVPLGPGYNNSGWEPAATDKTISDIPFSTTDFKPLPGSEALNVITTLPQGYPSTDFYGNPIRNGAAAGAVQP